MLYYCDKCGLVRNIFDSDKKECDFCSAILKKVPERYFSISCCMDDNERSLLREELVKTSSNYDEELFNQRYYWEIDCNNHVHSNLQKIKAFQQQTSNIPKCPTCSSTNIKKVSTTSKVTNTVLWGIFGTKRFKTFHCNSCGYEW